MANFADLVFEDGALSAVYSDLEDVLGEDVALLGELVAPDVRTERASHVEPSADGGWTADMAPVGGPVLGPFPLRAQALSAEREWLRDNLGI